MNMRHHQSINIFYCKWINDKGLGPQIGLLFQGPAHAHHLMAFYHLSAAMCPFTSPAPEITKDIRAPFRF